MAQVTKRSKEEMGKLWEEYGRTRDLKTKNILSEEYLPIVRYVAEKMIERLPHNVQIEDLVSAGVFGLFDAVDRFDLARGVKFEICEITLKNRNLKKEQFILGPTFTPSGVVRIANLQSRENYSYIKP